MGTIFINQDWTKIIDVGIDVSTAPTLRIIYRKPNSTTEVEVVATLYTSTSIYYEIPAATNNQAGDWLFRAKITDATGKTFLGEIDRVDVKTSWFPYT